MKKGTIALVVVLAAVLIGVLVFSKAKKPTQQPTSPAEDLTKKSDKPRLVKQEEKVVVSSFPAGFPVEEGAQKDQSYKYVPANSLEQQSTIEYVSQKTLAENGKIFTDYFNQASFKIINKVEQANLLFYYAKKDNNDLSVKIEKKDAKVTVSASYLKR